MSLQRKIIKRKRELTETGELKNMFTKAIEAKEKRRIKKFEAKCRKSRMKARRQALGKK